MFKSKPIWKTNTVQTPEAEAWSISCRADLTQQNMHTYVFIVLHRVATCRPINVALEDIEKGVKKS